MSPKTLIRLDGLFRPIYIILSVLRRYLGRNRTTNSKKIIIKFFGLGSITRIVNVCNYNGIPTRDLVFLTSDKNKDLIALLNISAIYIDSRNILTALASVLASIFKVWSKKDFDILDLERSSYVSGSLGLVLAIGKYHTMFNFTKDYEYKNQRVISLKNISLNNATSRALCEKTSFQQRVTIRDYQKIVVVNINAGDYIAERMFPLEKYADLLKLLYQHLPEHEFLLTGSPSEASRVNSFYVQLRDEMTESSRIKNLAGKMNLEAFCNLLLKSELCLTNDSSPLHLSQYFGVKTVCFWGPTSPKNVGYDDCKIMLNIKPEIGCSPCFLNPKSNVAHFCKGELTCFQEMNVMAIAEKINRFLLE